MLPNKRLRGKPNKTIMIKELEVLFNSTAMPKILRFFFQNEEGVFSSKEIAKRCQLQGKTAKKEIDKLKKINLLSKKIQKKKLFYNLNLKFSFLRELQTLILCVMPVSSKELASIFKNKKKIKLVVCSGIFLKESKSPVDLLIAGSKTKKSEISKIIKKIEADIGKEIKWSLMDVEEFNYRFEMNDRFLKEIFSHSHKKIIDRLSVGASRGAKQRKKQ